MDTKNGHGADEISDLGDDKSGKCVELATCSDNAGAENLSSRAGNDCMKHDEHSEKGDRDDSNGRASGRMPYCVYVYTAMMELSSEGCMHVLERCRGSLFAQSARQLRIQIMLITAYIICLSAVYAALNSTHGIYAESYAWRVSAGFSAGVVPGERSHTYIHTYILITYHKMATS
jgi:hypothetical protein